MNLLDAGIGFVAGMIILVAFDFFFYKNAKGSVNTSEFYETIESLRAELESAKAAEGKLAEAEQALSQSEEKVSALELQLSELPTVEVQPAVEYEDGSPVLLRETIAALEGRLAARKVEIEELQAKLDLVPPFQPTQADTEGLERIIAELEESVREKESRISELESAPVSSTDLSADGFLERINALEAGLTAKDAKIHELQLQINRPAVSEETEGRTRQLEAEVAKKDQLEERLVAALQELEDLRQKLAVPPAKANFDRQLAEKSTEILVLTGKLASRDADLAKVKKELESLKNSGPATTGVSKSRSASEDSDEPELSLVKHHQPGTPALELIEAEVATPELSDQIVAEALKAVEGKKATGPVPTSVAATAQKTAAKTNSSRAGRDTLEKIEGIGPVYQAKLWEAGVHKYSDLAGMTPEKIIEIIQPKDWQHVDAEAWIREANGYAQGESA